MSASDTVEVNFDGLVGPTHHYAGHSFGNVASMTHARAVSRPREAALQGLAKAKALRDRGLAQAFLPPLRKPRLDALRTLGFSGTDEEVIAAAFAQVPEKLSAVGSASSMWVANAATVSPSADTADGRVHFTAANLLSKFHRSLEGQQTARNLATIFAGPRFVHHAPLVGTAEAMGDEGAANHGRLCDRHGDSALEVFVYGHAASSPIKPKKFPARQSLEASRAVAEAHGVRRSIFLQQNPDAIDAGVFHNDVISVMNENVLFTHEKAFLDQAEALARLRAAYPGSRALEVIEVAESRVSLAECVQSYLFNSQLVTLPAGGMALVCPEECRENPRVWAEIQRCIASGGALREALTFDLRQSMRNGGGPACLRLRVTLTAEERAAVHPSVWLTDERYAALTEWVTLHYREELRFEDLRDPAFWTEVRVAMDALEAQLGFSLA